MSDTTTFTFPSASPGPDSVSVKIQKGVRYIGRVDTDGPAVWETLAAWLGVDSQQIGVGTMKALINEAVYQYFKRLPVNPPGTPGSAFLDGNFVMVESGEPPASSDENDVPFALQALVTAALTRYMEETPETADGKGLFRNGNFVNIGTGQ